MVHFLLVGVFVALSFIVCFLSFLYYYVCLQSLSTRDDGQLRSLSGIMKTYEAKPYFCFVMGCLGSSLFIAAGARSFSEETELQRDCILVLSLGMYVCLIGVVNYDLTYSKNVHLCFVFALVVLGVIFSFIAFGRGGRGGVATAEEEEVNCWNRVASIFYDVSVTLFVICCILNLHLKSQGFDVYRTPQSYLEICWVISLVFMMSMYAAFEPPPPLPLPATTTTETSSSLLHFFLGATVVLCGFLLSLFYSTPGLGYNSRGIMCVCYVIATTAPHYTFMLHVLSGLLSLSLVMKTSQLDENDQQQQQQNLVLIIIIIMFQICFTGLLGFDLINHGKIHSCFVLILFIVSLSFGWCFLLLLEDQDVVVVVWHTASIVVYSSASIAMAVISPSLVFLIGPTDAVLDAICHLEIAWVVAMVYMFGTCVFV